MLIRVNAESIAFQDGSRREGLKANESLEQLIQTQGRLYFRQFILNICINLYDYLGSILSYLILAVPIFSGAYDSLGPTDLTVIISQVTTFDFICKCSILK
jgi:ATP-binding cassette subfamily D (ALD) protein 4